MVFWDRFMKYQQHLRIVEVEVRKLEKMVEMMIIEWK